MKGLFSKLDAGLCFWFCAAKGFVALIDQLDREEVAHVLTIECKARAGWTDFQ